MNVKELEAVVSSITPVIRGAISAATEPLLKRLEALEARQPERGEKGDPGQNGDRGLDGPQGAKGDPGERGEKGERGEAGASGKDAEPILLSDVTRELIGMPELATLVSLHVAEAVAKYFEANPVKHGKDGRDGEPGPQGERGEKGDPGLAGERGPEGPQGIKGDPGQVGDRGEKGDPGANGRDGLDVREMLRNHEGHLIATMSDGTTRDLGEFIGKDGRDGADGVSLENVDLHYDSDAHEVVMSVSAAGKRKELRYPAGGIRPGGFWRDGMKCHALQAVTNDGALWIAKRDTSAKPCMENRDDWQLAARKGRDGRDGKDGAPPPGPVRLNGGTNA